MRAPISRSVLQFVGCSQIYLPGRSVGRSSVHQSVRNISESRAVFALLLLPNRPRLDCRISGIVWRFTVLAHPQSARDQHTTMSLINIFLCSYVQYDKPGKYGDEKATDFRFRPNELTAEHRTVLDSLHPGDEVELEWNHDYVTTKYKSGGSSSAPQRPVTHLKKK